MMNATRPVTVLHVEDDEMDVISLKRSFQRAKIANEIVVASHGEEALEILRGENGHNRIEPPFVMLVDVNMPRMNGIELIRAIRADATLSPSVVFVLTTSDHEKDILDAYALNVAGYLLKQDAGSQFLDAVNMLDTYWNVVEMPVH